MKKFVQWLACFGLLLAGPGCLASMVLHGMWLANIELGIAFSHALQKILLINSLPVGLLTIVFSQRLLSGGFGLERWKNVRIFRQVCPRWMRLACMISWAYAFMPALLIHQTGQGPMLADSLLRSQAVLAPFMVLLFCAGVMVSYTALRVPDRVLRSRFTTIASDEKI